MEARVSSVGAVHGCTATSGDPEPRARSPRPWSELAPNSRSPRPWHELVPERVREFDGALGSVLAVADDLAAHEVDDVLGDVGGVVRDAFQMA